MHALPLCTETIHDLFALKVFIISSNRFCFGGFFCDQTIFNSSKSKRKKRLYIADMTSHYVAEVNFFLSHLSASSFFFLVSFCHSYSRSLISFRFFCCYCFVRVQECMSLNRRIRPYAEREWKRRNYMCVRGTKRVCNIFWCNTNQKYSQIYCQTYVRMYKMQYVVVSVRMFKLYTCKRYIRQCSCMYNIVHCICMLAHFPLLNLLKIHRDCA